MARAVLRSLGGVLFLVGLAAVNAPAARAAEPIVVGATISQTGPLAADAMYQLRGEQLAIDEANAKGGWLGRQIQLKYYDDQSSPGVAVRLYQRLITEDKVNLLLGPYSSLVTIGIAPLINKYKMATLEPGASVPTIFAKGNEWNIQPVASSTTYLKQLLPIAKKNGAKTAALLGLQSAFTLACYKAREAQAKRLGIKVVYDTTYALPQPDFSSIALAIKNAHPDVVLACTYYPDAVGILRSLHQQGFAPKYLGLTVGPSEPAFLKAVGPLANRVVSNTSWWPNFKTPGNAQFIAAYKKKYGEPPDYHAAAGYSGVEVLAAAVKGTGSLDQAKLRDWLLANKVPTVQGPFKVNKYGRAVGATQELFQIQDAVPKLMTPKSLSQGKVLEPYTGS
ncbi:MAG TPA: amino acid ABC transporter substrate-binding protein [Stellaceae bacterium]|nr:amino acid ABC transporter substrate-binding protein [Stellaceae bacterium]